MTRPASATIDLAALRHNAGAVRKAAPNSRVMAVVKANGYGHGSVRVARALDNVDALAVSSLEEAVVLRDAGEQRRIVLLEGFFDAAELAAIAQFQFDIVVHHDWQLDILEHHRSSVENPLNVWLKIDSGMHRLGVPPAAVAGAVRRLTACACVAPTLRFMTHFACADDLAREDTIAQLNVFDAALENLSGERSAANSAGAFGWARSHYDWVRPGISLYGATPFVARSADAIGIRPVMTLATKLIAIEQRVAGDAIGYGATWQCPEAMRIGVAAIGYGDGYPRHAPSGTPVLVDGVRTQIVGRVSMDMICVDLRPIPNAHVGSDVVLWGEKLSVDEVAARAGTIAYELFCGVASRVRFEESSGDG